MPGCVSRETSFATTVDQAALSESSKMNTGNTLREILIASRESVREKDVDERCNQNVIALRQRLRNRIKQQRLYVVGRAAGREPQQ